MADNTISTQLGTYFQGNSASCDCSYEVASSSTQPSVTNVGTTQQAIFHFVLPSLTDINTSLASCVSQLGLKVNVEDFNNTVSTLMTISAFNSAMASYAKLSDLPTFKTINGVSILGTGNIDTDAYGNLTMYSGTSKISGIKLSQASTTICNHTINILKENLSFFADEDDTNLWLLTTNSLTDYDTAIKQYIEGLGYATTSQIPTSMAWSAITGKPATFDDLSAYALKSELFSGSYNDLTDRPTLFDGNYNSLSNLPTLFDGDYNSLKNLPTIPSIEGLASETYVQDYVKNNSGGNISLNTSVTLQAVTCANSSYTYNGYGFSFRKLRFLGGSSTVESYLATPNTLQNFEDYLKDIFALKTDTPDLSNYYTKDEVETNYYSKSEVETNYYLKSEVDSKISTLESKIAELESKISGGGTTTGNTFKVISGIDVPNKVSNGIEIYDSSWSSVATGESEASYTGELSGNSVYALLNLDGYKLTSNAVLSVVTSDGETELLNTDGWQQATYGDATITLTKMNSSCYQIEISNYPDSDLTLKITGEYAERVAHTLSITNDIDNKGNYGNGSSYAVVSNSDGGEGVSGSESTKTSCTVYVGEYAWTKVWKSSGYGIATYSLINTDTNEVIASGEGNPNGVAIDGYDAMFVVIGNEIQVYFNSYPDADLNLKFTATTTELEMASITFENASPLATMYNDDHYIEFNDCDGNQTTSTTTSIEGESAVGYGVNWHFFLSDTPTNWTLKNGETTIMSGTGSDQVDYTDEESGTNWSYSYDGAAYIVQCYSLQSGLNLTFNTSE